MGEEDNPLVPQSSGNLAVSNFGNVNEDFEGSGIFGDAKSTIVDGASGDWGALGADLGGDALDGLGVAMDPLGSLVGGGIGWLVEHISFLKKPLDLLAGDPDAVTRKAQTWTNISQQLTKTAGDYQDSANALAQQHKGPAAQAYSQAASDFSQTVAASATHAQSAAKAMNFAGGVVGTTRGLIRDSLAQFAGDALVKYVAASALTEVTFGGSDAAFIVDEVAEGASLAAKCAGKLSKVAEALDKLGTHASKSAETLEKAGSKLAKASEKADKGADKAATAAAKGSKDAKEADSATKLEDFQKKADHFNDNSVAKDAEEADKLNAERGKLVDERVDAWKQGLQERLFGGAPSKDSFLGKVQNRWLEPEGEYKHGVHSLVGHVVDVAHEGTSNAFSDQSTREGDIAGESAEDLEKYEKEYPDYNGSLSTEVSFTPTIEPAEGQ